MYYNTVIDIIFIFLIINYTQLLAYIKLVYILFISIFPNQKSVSIFKRLIKTKTLVSYRCWYVRFIFGLFKIFTS